MTTGALIFAYNNDKIIMLKWPLGLPTNKTTS